MKGSLGICLESEIIVQGNLVLVMEKSALRFKLHPLLGKGNKYLKGNKTIDSTDFHWYCSTIAPEMGWDSVSNKTHRDCP